MKFSLFFLTLFAASSTFSADAFVPQPSASTNAAASTTRLFYDIQRDPQPNDNVWSILSNTEKWISNTLAESQTGSNNPLSRKEVSYVCETSNDPAMILANIFRKVKEARQLGESHAQDQEDLVDQMGGKNNKKLQCRAACRNSSLYLTEHLVSTFFFLFLLATEDKHNRVTLRQTQVLVIPANDEMTQNFPVFDAVINAINQARRGARDLVTDYALEKIDEQMYGEVEDRDWV